MYMWQIKCDLAREGDMAFEIKQSNSQVSYWEYLASYTNEGAKFGRMGEVTVWN